MHYIKRIFSTKYNNHYDDNDGNVVHKNVVEEVHKNMVEVAHKNAVVHKILEAVDNDDEVHNT